MKKTQIFLISVCFLTLFISSCNAVDMTSSDVIQSIYEKQSGINSYKVNVEFFENGTLTYEGLYMYAKPNKFRKKGKIVNEEGATSLIISDGEYIWTYYPFANMVNKDRAPNHYDITELMTNIEVESKNYSNVDNDGVKAVYKIHYIGDESVDGNDCYVLEAVKNIILSEEEKYDFHVKMYFDKLTGLIKEVKFLENSKVASDMLFKDYVIGPLNDSNFVFDIPDEAIINEVPQSKDSTEKMGARFYKPY